MSNLLLLLCFLTFSTVTYCDDPKTEDWVDPFDMLSFDPVSKKNLLLTESEKVRIFNN